jgi:hypothetical protein
MASANDALDASLGGGEAYGSAGLLVQVYDGGSMPNQPDHVYLTHPVNLDGAEQEGTQAPATADTSTSVPVVVIRNAPQAGDILVAHAVGGRWVAESGGGKCNPNVTLGTAWCNCVAPGTITVTVREGDCPGGAIVFQDQADDNGQAVTQLPPGDYCVSAATTASGYLNFASSFTLDATGTITAGSTGSPIYPDHLVVTDGVSGLSASVYPYGTMPWIVGTSADGSPGQGSSSQYWGELGQFNIPACVGPDNTCPATTVTLYVSYFCQGAAVAAGGASLVQVVFGEVDDGSGFGTTCPGDGGIGGSLAPGGWSAAVCGVGPIFCPNVGVNLGDSCYPLAQSGPVQWTACGSNPNTNPPTLPVNYSGTTTVTQ